MAVYKIPQDVEADDKFVGPLSFKQFIYCGIAAICGYLSFLSLTKGLWPALFVFLPVITAAGFLGFPWGRDQPTEVWLAARIRFFLKPRVRIWNQSGIKELVTITVPKKIERHLTNGLDQNEVSSRLSGLADLLDSRGWAVKNVNVNLYSNPITSTVDQTDDRLVDVSALPQEVVEVTANDDVLDESVSPTAQHFEEMIKTSEQKHRQEVMSQLQAARTDPAATDTAQPAQASQQGNADFWFLQQGAHEGQHQAPAKILEEIAPKQPVAPEAGFTTFRGSDVVAPHSAAAVPVTSETTYASQTVSHQDEENLLAKIHKNQDESYNPFGHIKTIQPLDEGGAPAAADPAAAPQQPAQAPLPPPVTPPVNPAIMSLASNDDLNVATLARQAEKSNKERPSDDEVVVSLR